MKRSAGIIFILFLISISCEKWIDPEININPDNPNDVSIGVLLPAIEGSLAYYYGGIDVVGIRCIWIQQLTASDRAFNLGRYQTGNSETNNLWNNMYQGVLMDIEKLIEKAENPDKPEKHMAGAAKILKALALSLVTDTWGSVPYSEAFLGSEELTPVYDDQESIYAEIMKLLNEAISDLQSDESFVGIMNDYIYNGDASKWLKAAYMLKARYTMRLAGVYNTEYDQVITDLENGFEGIEDNMEQPFDSGSSAGYNPLYQFTEQRTGYVDTNPVYDKMMTQVVKVVILKNEGGVEHDDTINIHDPRNGIQNWSEKGYWSSKGSPVLFIGFTEGLFLRAEALFRRGNESDAKTMLKEAYQSSVNQYRDFLISNVYIPGNGYPVDFPVDSLFFHFKDHLENEVESLNGEDLLEKIMVEKYKHLFAHSEPYNDWRRTGYPSLSPVHGKDIPKRYPYPQDEIQFNRENVPDVSIFQRVWWDVD